MVTKYCHHYYIIKYVMQKRAGVYSAYLPAGHEVLQRFWPAPTFAPD